MANDFGYTGKILRVDLSSVSMSDVPTDIYADKFLGEEVSLPVLVTISNELGELRSANLRKLMEAQKMPVTTWNAREVGIEAAPIRRIKLLDLYMPQKESRCEMVDGADAEESGANLALRLKEAGII